MAYNKMNETIVLPNPTIIYRGPLKDVKKACTYVSKILADKGLGLGRVCWRAPKDGEFHYGHPEKDVYTVALRGSNDLIKDSFAVYRDAYGSDFWNNCDASPDGWVNPLDIPVRDVATECKSTDEKYKDCPHVSPYLVETALNILKNEHGWKLATEDDVAYYIEKYWSAFVKAYNDSEKSGDGPVRDGIDAILNAEDAEATRAEYGREFESKSADEKLGYEKGHKNSKGEDAPWVIRSHKDNRVLASFATEDEAKEHMKRMKQYSKGESNNESYELASKEIQVRKPDVPWRRWSVTWPEYVNTHIKDAKAHGWPEVRVVDLNRSESKKSEAVNMDGFKNMLRTYNAKGDSVKNGPWRICDGAYDLWFELYYNETPILGCTGNICKWYSNPETVGMTLDDYKKIEDAISSEIFAIDSFKMPESKQSEGLNNEQIKDAVKFAANESGLEDYLNVDSDGAMSVTVSLPINSDELHTVRWVIDSNEGTITEYLDDEENLIRDFTDDETLVSMLTLLFQTTRKTLRQWLPKKSESLADNPSDIHTQLSNLIKQDKIITFLNDDDGPVIYMDASKGSIPYGDYLLKYLGIDSSAMMVSGATVYNVEDIESYDKHKDLSPSFIDDQKNKGINKVCKITTKYLTKPKKSEGAGTPKEVDTVLKKNAPKLIDILNSKFKEAGFNVELKLTDPENARFSDGWYLNTTSTGNWTDPSRRFNWRLDGTEYNGVVYNDGSIYLKNGMRPASHRGVVVNPLGIGESNSDPENTMTYELTEDAVTDLIKELGLEIVNTWYDGNKDRIVYDCKDKGDENGETVCVWVEPPYEARVWLKDVNPRVNQLVEDIETIDALKAALVDIFKIELGESHITESLRKPEDTIIVPNWLWETYTLGENYDGDTLTDDEQQTYLDFKEKYEGFSLKAVSEKTTFRSDNDFDSNGCPCYEVNVFKK